MSVQKPRLLDLFCCAGGATRGYQLAGFYVVGVDIRPQPRYVGDEFYQADALEFVAAHGHKFDAIHASPPCQRYSEITPEDARENYPDLIAPTQALLRRLGRPYIIENVPGAARLLSAPIRLCGFTFGLKTYRHRFFECEPMILAPPHHNHPEACPPSGRGRSDMYGIISVTGNGGAPNLHMPYLDYASDAMGIDWMSREELSEAVPPAYTEYLGRQLMAYVLEGMAR